MKLSLNRISVFLFLLALVLAPGGSVYSQSGQYQIDFTHTEDFTVTGTSTLTDWSVAINKIGGEPATLSGFDENGGAIESFYFFATVDEMDGGRGETMNDKIKIALKSEEFPKVEYRQVGSAKVQPSGTANSEFTVISSGNLTVGGLVKPIELQLKSTMQQNGNVLLTCVKDFTFSEFEIEPPSALFGQIVCGDEIQININLLLKPTPQN